MIVDVAHMCVQIEWFTHPRISAHLFDLSFALSVSHSVWFDLNCIHLFINFIHTSLVAYIYMPRELRSFNWLVDISAQSILLNFFFAISLPLEIIFGFNYKIYMVYVRQTKKLNWPISKVCHWQFRIFLNEVWIYHCFFPHNRRLC